MVKRWEKVVALEHRHKEVKWGKGQFRSWVFIEGAVESFESFKAGKERSKIFILKRSLGGERFREGMSIYGEIIQEAIIVTQARDESCLD